MKELSVSDVMAFRPCYPEDKIIKLFDGKDKLTLLDILDLDIPAEDKVWVLTRPGILPDAILKEFADLTTDRAVRKHCLSCGLPAVEAWAAKWLDGSDRSAEAAYAAREAAWMTAYAAYGAAYGAAEAARAACGAAYWAAEAAYGAAEAARAACGAAYWAASGEAREAACGVAWSARGAACNVACGAAYEAESQQQIADLRRLIGA